MDLRLKSLNVRRLSHAVLSLILIISEIISMSSCITYREINYLQNSGPGIPNYADTAKYHDYRLQPGDRLYIQVLSLNPDVSKLFQQNQSQGGDNGNSDLFTYRIDSLGSLTFPYVGKIHAGGKTTREVKTLLEEKATASLGNCYFRVSLANNYFTVIGAGGTGRYPLFKSKLTIFEALAISGDLNSMADRSKIRILRQTPTGTVIKTFDIRGKSIIGSEYYYVQPNDILYIQPMSMQFFGITSWSGLLSSITMSVSFVLIFLSIYHYVKK
ncbi:polysaccharide biosynthesis/export family protein [Microbacter margulisiae]|uniref:Polysaccharide export outer membrane protein n=1 Tax=Microbacter margulisiae TaxID=1350067 RepID=A0A7W5DP27_9PORP|nr:polysaccharide biosynthesis/export family protein [Microbacter margulisiae]MBB3186460.1 polysaccharide export outer membrane protein [Microbacter margulisiae]